MDSVPRTNREVVEYISRFNNQQKETVLMEITKSDVLQKFLQSVEGGVVMESVISNIRDYTMQIVRTAIDPKADYVKEFSQLGLKINTAYNFMLSLATIAQKGLEHDERMNP